MAEHSIGSRVGRAALVLLATAALALQGGAAWGISWVVTNERHIKDQLFCIRVLHGLAVEPKPDSSGFPHPKLGWHEHINYFSEKSLAELFGRLGLDVVKFLDLRLGNDPVSRGVVISR